MEFKVAKCPTCGGNLQLPEDREVVKCMYCGNDVIVQKAIAEAASASVPSLLKLADNAFEGKNYQESYYYYTKVLELDSNNEEGWIGKGISAAYLISATYLSTRDISFNEANLCFKRALEINPQSEKVKAGYATVKILKGRFFYLLGWDELCNGMTAWNNALGSGDIERNDRATPYCKRSLEYLEESLKLYEPDLAVYMGGHDEYAKIKVEVMDRIVQLFHTFPDVWEPSFRDETVKRYIANIKQLDPNYKPPDPESKSGFSIRKTPSKSSGCFIATACYGSPQTIEVQILKRWRDEYLIKHFGGRVIVGLYYQISPSFANWIVKAEKRKHIVRKPLSILVNFLVSKKPITN